MEVSPSLWSEAPAGARNHCPHHMTRYETWPSRMFTTPSYLI